MGQLGAGEKAIDFCLPDDQEQDVCLKDFRGQWIILYFYPKDNTPGCSLEAMDFSRLKSEFEQENTVILGVSKDSCKSHQDFIDKKRLTIKLLSDPDADTHKKYGVWRPKKFLGREFLGTVRSTFLIDPKGKISKTWLKVKVKGHAEEVLNEVKKLNKEPVK